MQTNQIIKKHINHFRIYNPFYADLLEEFNINENKTIETAGVWITNKINLDINLEFFNSLVFNEQLAILEHEINHITNYHIYRSKNKDKGLFNVAADISINQYIDNLPKGALYPEKNMKENASTEYYYKILEETINKIKNMLQKYSDLHSTWNKSDMNKVLDTITKEISKSIQKGNVNDKQIEKLKKELDDMKNEKQNKFESKYGEKHSVDELIKKINDCIIISNRKINWKQELRKFIMKNTEKKKRNTIKYPNKRYNTPYGRCKMRSDNPNGIIVVDISPSISMSVLNLFKQEIKKLRHLLKEIRVFLVDDEIREEFVIKNNNDKFFEDKSINTGSGTDLIKIFKHIQKNRIHNYGFLIYFTDLESSIPDKTLEPTYPVLWAIYNKGRECSKTDVNFGEVLQLNDN